MPLRKHRRSAPEEALGGIQRLITAQGLRPGDRLPSERELAERLSVSRATLRIALATLETLGIIRIQAGQGAFLVEKEGGSPLNLESAWHFADRYAPGEVYQLRFAIEGFAARMAARRADEAEIHRLRVANQAMKEALEAGDLLAGARQDFAFHLAVLRLGGNRAMEQIILNLDRLILETQLMPLSSRARLLEPIDEHEELIVAIERQDAELACVMMRHHIAGAADRIGASFRVG